MSLPFFHTYNMKSSSFEELSSILTPELNLRYPVVINLKALDKDQQRETIGLIENYFVSNNLSYLFPYPVYIITVHESSISGLPLVRSADELPRFYQSREGKMNVKESHLAGKNKLLQLEIHNTDAGSNELQLESYGQIHREIFEQDLERVFYRSILNKLMKMRING